eukprot:5577167-Pyramimonas_sp.AAC.1
MQRATRGIPEAAITDGYQELKTVCCLYYNPNVDLTSSWRSTTRSRALSRLWRVVSWPSLNREWDLEELQK